MNEELIERYDLIGVLYALYYVFIGWVIDIIKKEK